MGAIGAVFKSWNGRRAVSYRKIEGIPGEWGTACNVQSMVFGNLGDTSATGVAFTRNPATGENKFYGEWLVNAQGEDVVAGIRTPNPFNEETKNEQNRHLPSLETDMPELYKQLCDIRTKLEHHYHDMQDIEFTIQEGKLYMLQCRNGKRTGTAALNMAMDMLGERLIDKPTAVLRVSRSSSTNCCTRSSTRTRKRTPSRCFPACRPGRAGPAARSSSPPPRPWRRPRGRQVILVREETNPEDVEGMRAAEGILTARGGMTSHAALVARGWGKCCIVGAGGLKINLAASTMTAGAATFKQGDLLTLNGTKGRVYAGALGHDRRHGEPPLPGVHEAGRPAPDHGRAHQRRHAGGRPRRPQLRRRGHRAVPHRAHVLRQGRGGAAFRAAEDDHGPGQEAKPAKTKQARSRLEKVLEERKAVVNELFPFVKRASRRRWRR